MINFRPFFFGIVFCCGFLYVTKAQAGEYSFQPRRILVRPSAVGPFQAHEGGNSTFVRPPAVPPVPPFQGHGQPRPTLFRPPVAPPAPMGLVHEAYPQGVSTEYSGNGYPPQARRLTVPCHEAGAGYASGDAESQPPMPPVYGTYPHGSEPQGHPLPASYAPPEVVYASGYQPQLPTMFVQLPATSAQMPPSYYPQKGAGYVLGHPAPQPSAFFSTVVPAPMPPVHRAYPQGVPAEPYAHGYGHPLPASYSAQAAGYGPGHPAPQPLAFFPPAVPAPMPLVHRAYPQGVPAEPYAHGYGHPLPASYSAQAAGYGPGHQAPQSPAFFPPAVPASMPLAYYPPQAAGYGPGHPAPQPLAFFPPAVPASMPLASYPPQAAGYAPGHQAPQSPAFFPPAAPASMPSVPYAAQAVPASMPAVFEPKKTDADPNATLFSEARDLENFNKEQGIVPPEALRNVKLPEKKFLVDFLRKGTGDIPPLLYCLEACVQREGPLLLVYASRDDDEESLGSTVLCLPGYFQDDGTFKTIEIYSFTMTTELLNRQLTITNVTDDIVKRHFLRDGKIDFSTLCEINNGVDEKVQQWLQKVNEEECVRKRINEAVEKSRRKDQLKLEEEARALARAAEEQRIKEEQDRLAASKKEAEKNKQHLIKLLEEAERKRREELKRQEAAIEEEKRLAEIAAREEAARLAEEERKRQKESEQRGVIDWIAEAEREEAARLAEEELKNQQAMKAEKHQAEIAAREEAERLKVERRREIKALRAQRKEDRKRLAEEERERQQGMEAEKHQAETAAREEAARLAEEKERAEEARRLAELSDAAAKAAKKGKKRGNGKVDEDALLREAIQRAKAEEKALMSTRKELEQQVGIQSIMDLLNKGALKGAEKKFKSKQDWTDEELLELGEKVSELLLQKTETKIKNQWKKFFEYILSLYKAKDEKILVLKAKFLSKMQKYNEAFSLLKAAKTLLAVEEKIRILERHSHDVTQQFPLCSGPNVNCKHKFYEEMLKPHLDKPAPCGGEIHYAQLMIQHTSCFGQREKVLTKAQRLLEKNREHPIAIQHLATVRSAMGAKLEERCALCLEAVETAKRIIAEHPDRYEASGHFNAVRTLVSLLLHNLDRDKTYVDKIMSALSGLKTFEGFFEELEQLFLGCTDSFINVSSSAFQTLIEKLEKFTHDPEIPGKDKFIEQLKSLRDRQLKEKAGAASSGPLRSGQAWRLFQKLDTAPEATDSSMKCRREIGSIDNVIQKEELDEIFTTCCPDLNFEKQQELVKKVITSLNGQEIQFSAAEEADLPPLVLCYLRKAPFEKCVNEEELITSQDGVFLRLCGQAMLRLMQGMNPAKVTDAQRKVCCDTLKGAAHKGDQYANVLLVQQRIMGLSLETRQCNESGCWHLDAKAICNAFLGDSVRDYKRENAHQILAFLNGGSCKDIPVNEAEVKMHIEACQNDPVMRFRKLVLECNNLPSGTERKVAFESGVREFCGAVVSEEEIRFLDLLTIGMKPLTSVKDFENTILILERVLGVFYDRKENFAHDIYLKAFHEKISEIVDFLTTEIQLHLGRLKNPLEGGEEDVVIDKLQYMRFLMQRFTEVAPGLSAYDMSQLQKIEYSILEVLVKKELISLPDFLEVAEKLIVLNLENIINSVDVADVYEIMKELLKNKQGLSEEEALIVQRIEAKMLGSIDLIEESWNASRDNYPPLLGLTLLKIAVDQDNLEKFSLVMQSLLRMVEERLPEKSVNINSILYMMLIRQILSTKENDPILQEGISKIDGIIKSVLRGGGAQEIGFIFAQKNCVCSEQKSSCDNARFAEELRVFNRAIKCILTATDDLSEDIFKGLSQYFLTFMHSGGVNVIYTQNLEKVLSSHPISLVSDLFQSGCLMLQLISKSTLDIDKFVELSERLFLFIKEIPENFGLKIVLLKGLIESFEKISAQENLNKQLLGIVSVKRDECGRLLAVFEEMVSVYVGDDRVAAADPMPPMVK